MLLASICMYSIIIVGATIGMSMSILVLLIMWFRRSTIRAKRVDYLLVANPYIAVLFTSPWYFDMCAYSIYGHLHSNSSFDGWWCRVKCYFIYVTGSVYFYSFLIQAIYRFVRIVHQTRLALRSFRLYLIISIGQWIFGFVQLLPILLTDEIEYLPDDYHCQFAPTNLRSTLIGLTLLYLIPYILTVICYICTVYHVRTHRAASTTIRRTARIRRDLTILTRLVALLTFVTTVALPHLLIPIVYVASGYIPPWASPFEWLLTFISLIIVSILQIFTSRHLKKLYTRTNRIHPGTTLVQSVYQ